MSQFQVQVKRIDHVVDHPNADRLTINTVAGYRCISAKLDDGSPRYSAGDLAVYIPEQAVLPEWLLKEMDFWKDGKGTLAGSRGDRVRAVKLRNVVSQGILYPLETNAAGESLLVGMLRNYVVQEGDDVAEALGIVKYEPPIPTNMAGEVWNASGMTLNYDIESLQKYPNVFQEGEEVVVTEKLHGTFVCYGLYWDGEEYTTIVTSKGLGAKGLALKFSDKNLRENIYLRVLENTRDENGDDLLERIERKMKLAAEIMEPMSIYLLGEIYGKGIQDLTYGETVPQFRVFDVYVGQPGQGSFLEAEHLETTGTLSFQDIAQINTVPVLYKGPFSQAVMDELRDGACYSGHNIREGIVITPARERTDPELGRVKLKYVSPDYLTRKGGTEYN